MSHWNYRVIAKKINGEVEFGIHEVHYDENEKIVGWTGNSINMSTYSIHAEQYGVDPVESLK